jgi:hypothetical protein
MAQILIPDVFLYYFRLINFISNTEIITIVYISFIEKLYTLYLPRIRKGTIII